MTSSESDNDCFESADEGSDDEINIKYRYAESHLSKDESGNVELSSPISSDTPSASVSESESTGNSEQYRKRPERRKDLIEKKNVKHQFVKKLSLNDQIFKTEKIKPDILIQDITHNLSKNFNRGLNTIQQTSNSLKDLVLHALPVPTVETTKSGFSYDDEEEIVIQKSDEEDSDSNNIKNFTLNESNKVENLGKDNKEVEVNAVQVSNLSDSRKIEEQYQKIKQEVKFCNLSNEDSKCKKKEPKINLCAENNKRKDVAEKSIEDFIVDSTAEDLADCFEEQNSNFEMKDDIHTEIKEIESNNLFHSDNNSLLTKNEESNISGWDFSDFSMKSTENEKDFANNLIVQENPRSLVSNEQKLKDLENDEILNKNSENSLNLGVNDGWDDFDFDEDIDCITASEKKSTTNNLTKEKHEKVIVDKSDVNDELENKFFSEETKSEINNLSKNENDCKWSGWDSFGEKQEAKQKTTWNLGTWGVSALLNTATCVTQGISNVIEVGLGAPDPEILAKMEKQSDENSFDLDDEKHDSCEFNESSALLKEDDNSNSGLNLFPVLNLVAGVTNKIVEHSKVHEIGSKVISGSLDTLETFGKKTMEVLQEGDPGLKKKRALFLGLDKPILSQVLREAKMKNELKDKHEEKEMVKMFHFETLFDDFQGLVHLEALEMLSRQCELKLDQMKTSLPSDEVNDLISIMDEVKELCIIEDNEMESDYLEVIDFKTSLKKAVEPLKNEISVERIIEVHDELDKWLKSEKNSVMSSHILLHKGMSAMAELTAATVHQFHKCGELLSIKERRKTVEEADVLLQMTGLLTGEINNLSKKFLKLYSSLANESKSESHITALSKIEEQAANATTYIKDAFNLLIPVLQLGAAV